ncbi:GtrA family protein [Massilia oculi]|uniref:GtrA family protein n=1 Tax=Massilia oculi TaxID=945844 RepID=A0A2S2DL82_9BURK|nr:GtrA family protein [Massilia oculi]
MPAAAGASPRLRHVRADRCRQHLPAFGAVIALVETGLAGPVAANVAGFALANTCSFFANCRFTFRQPPSWNRYRKFLAVSMLSLALTVALSALAEALRWHYLIGLALVLLCGPVLTFALHKAVTFRHQA